jgi:hypothetical protein
VPANTSVDAMSRAILSSALPMTAIQYSRGRAFVPVTPPGYHDSLRLRAGG